MTTTTIIDLYAIETRLAFLCSQKRACQDDSITNETLEVRINVLTAIRDEVKRDARSILEYCSELGVIDRTCAQLFDRIMQEL